MIYSYLRHSEYTTDFSNTTDARERVRQAPWTEYTEFYIGPCFYVPHSSDEYLRQLR